MLEFAHETQIYLACGVTDLRKSFNGLAAIVKLRFHLDPYSKSMFVFCNRNRSLIKILQWDGSGLWLHTKRLSKDSFRWPESKEDVRKISIRQLQWLCDGLSIEQSNAFKEHHPKIIV